MSRKGFILIVFLFIISIGMISSVSADDSGDVLSNSSNDEVGIEEIDDLESEDVEIDESVSQDGDDDLQAEPGTFTALEYLIYLNSGQINLDRDYNYNDDFQSRYTFMGYHIPGVNIHKSITINGNGHSINGMSKSVLLYIDADNVVLKNIVFKNAYWSDSLAQSYPFAVSDAISWTGNNAVLDNCTFIGPSQDTNVRAVSFNGNKNTVKNCNFNDICNPSYAGISSRGDEMNISNCNFTNCISNGYCGVVSLNGNNNKITKCNFNKCHSKDRGGAVQLEGGKNTISYSNFIECYANDGGNTIFKGLGGAIYSSSPCVVDHCNFIGTYASGNGGAIFLSKYLTGATVSYCNFNSSRAKNGGALYRETPDKSVTPTDISVSNCKFVSCDADNDGGAVYSNSTKNKVSSCKFDLCSAGSTGGAICFEKNSADSSVSGCDFKNCTAVEYAGAVYCYGNNGALSKCNFYDCYSEDGGAIYWDGVRGNVSNSKFIRCNAEYAGAIDWDGDEGTLTGCDFNDCKASDEGGAVYWETDNSKMVNCNFNGCNASNGGAVYCDDSIFKATISGCKFINCAASEYGGALLFDNARNLIVESSTFSGNSANNGGAIESYNSTVVKVSSSTFSDNIAEKAGGAVWAKNVYGIQLDSSDFVHNSAKGEKSLGGAVYMSNNNITVIDSCDFERNSANYSAGAVFMTSVGQSVIRYSTFSQNFAEYSGGVRSVNSESYVISSKFTKNTDAGYGSAVYGVYAADCDFIGNTDPQTCATTVYPGTQLTFKQSGSYFNDNVVVTVTLKGKDGAILSKEVVKVVFNGKTTNYTTNSKGQISFKVKLAPKTYPITMSFDAHGKYYGSTASAKVVIKKATPKMTASNKAFKLKVKTKKYTIVLKDNKGKVMKSTKVKLTVKGKTYSAKTNSKGKATFSIKNLKKKGKFTATVKYAGSSNFNAVTKKVKITVKK